MSTSAQFPDGPPTHPGEQIASERRPPGAPPPCRHPRPTVEDALRMATRRWLAGERLDMGRLAAQLHIGRATLFRWVGTRDQLYEQVLCRVYARQREHVIASAKGRGLELLENVARQNLTDLAESRALRCFIAHDAEHAIRLLTSPKLAPQRQSVAMQRAFLERVVEEAGITPQLDLTTLAHIIVRIGEAFLYADTIAGDALDVEKAIAAIRILVAAGAPTSGG